MGFFYVYGVADVNHRCRLPESIWPNDNSYNSINSTHEKLLEQFIPKTKDGKSWEQCIMHSKSVFSNSTIDCPNGWVYDRSVFGILILKKRILFVIVHRKKVGWQR